MVTLLSAREAGKVLGVSHVTVGRWVRARKLKPAAESTFGPLFDPDYVREVARRLELERATAQPERLEAAS